MSSSNYKFFHFDQNNIHGRFHTDHNSGISRHVVVEAKDSAHANELAEEQIGLDFDAACDCCGMRWEKVGTYYEDEGSEVPTISGQDVSQGQVSTSHLFNHRWT